MSKAEQQSSWREDWLEVAIEIQPRRRQQAAQRRLSHQIRMATQITDLDPK
ncbi:hypothetical protein SynSYN20_02098 [Synechococcus sp. SYN20]|nr:hypothetical protein SynSYN20_02098 [Synechococcus sp. SYN20]